MSVAIVAITSFCFSAAPLILLRFDWRSDHLFGMSGAAEKQKDVGVRSVEGFSGFSASHPQAHAQNR
ncbi:MAG: hypothetical protein DME25_20400 [Verrucomicrobia bacterium]|nr:MAG: hypothetical protein DME25_20400 [Verrucomicrobiota bacterium]